MVSNDIIVLPARRRGSAEPLARPDPVEAFYVPTPKLAK